MFRMRSAALSLGSLFSDARSTMAMLHGESHQCPIVVILGATGAGKSKLALELGQVLNGEIISADSMQVYKGLDIVTNKVSREEQELCKHHLIGFVSPLEEYTVVDYQKHARDLIQAIHSQKKLPIICGGTSYYIESILWEYLTSPQSAKDDEELLKLKTEHTKIREELEAMDSADLHDLLEKTDSERALRLHPSDRRKVIRSIEIFRQTGMKHSDLLQSQVEGRRYGGPLIYRNICFIWVQCDEEVLKERVEKRVDKMLEAGLLAELNNFHAEYNESRLNKDDPPDYEHGIFQSIGFKEFHKYLTEDLSEEDKAKCLSDAIARMKLSTWQYAKYQTKWLRKRLVNRQDSANVYAVDSTFPSRWKESVYYPALRVLGRSIDWGNFVEGITSKSPVFEMAEVKNAKQLDSIPKVPQSFDDTPRMKRSCTLCGGKIFLSDKEWEVHVKSRRHKKSIAAQKRRLNVTVDILSCYEDSLKRRTESNSAEHT